jgi:hypothetical protein
MTKGDYVFTSLKKDIPANGAYIVRVSTNNIPVLAQKVIIQK